MHVRLYGPFSLASGRSNFPMERKGTELSVQDFLSSLAGRIPKIEQALKGETAEKILKQRLMLVINGEICLDKSKLIRDGDQIKILTPITGG